MKRLVIFLIGAYKIVLSPILSLVFGKGCRFTPTCSEYSIKAIENHGLLPGGKLSLQRFARCHPFSEGGYNPIPIK